MQVYERQSLGALTLLVASLVFYGVSLLSDYRPFREFSMPWKDQASRMIAVEIKGRRAIEGIYFLPEGTTFTDILKMTGMFAKIDKQLGRVDADFSNNSALTISTEEGVLRIADMTAVRRLALGLKIDVNSSSAEELSLVPGIGEKMAAQIVHVRQARGKFDTLSDLTTIPGIKEKRLDGLKKYITIGSIP
jgi:competence protein ComEA